MKKILLTCLVLAFGSLAFGQKSKVTSGSMLVQDGDFEKAITVLNEAVSKPEMLEKKDLAKAYTKLGTAYVGIIAKKDTNLIKSKYPNILDDAFNAYEKAREHDDGKNATEINGSQSMLAQGFYMGSFELYKLAGKSNSKEMYKEAAGMLKNAIKNYEFRKDANLYALYQLRGFCYSGAGDTAKAIEDLEKTIAMHNAAPPQKPDEAMPEVYASLAQLHAGYKGGNYDKMSAVLTEAETKFPGNERISNVKIYLYANNEKLLDKAIVKFEEDLKKDPKNPLLRRAYAQLLEKKDPKKALDMYKSIIADNPNDKDVLFNTGAILNNMAKELYDKANKIDDNAEYKKTMDQAKATFAESLGFMDKAYKLSKVDGKTSKNDLMVMLGAMIQIAKVNEQPDKAAEYNKELEEIKARAK